MDKCITLTSYPRIVGTSDLAKILGRTPRYVRNLARDRLIPSIHMPDRDVLFDTGRVFEALHRFEVQEIAGANSRN